ncbi:hypothetical protein OIU77_016157 [Salix suchowensis]|uniref:Uncharacterized protein n=1 Tax=Salix suchowensis TaxID=1278906 RepID=A0ABQ8ZJI4_9ROSI|nr:hypothetical protein OIU77_016157 [Salix suchowensis]
MASITATYGGQALIPPINGGYEFVSRHLGVTYTTGQACDQALNSLRKKTKLLGFLSHIGLATFLQKIKVWRFSHWMRDFTSPCFVVRSLFEHRCSCGDGLL